jgi:hypothetical protein
MDVDTISYEFSLSPSSDIQNNDLLRSRAFSFIPQKWHKVHGTDIRSCSGGYPRYKTGYRKICVHLLRGPSPLLSISLCLFQLNVLRLCIKGGPRFESHLLRLAILNAFVVYISRSEKMLDQYPQLSQNRFLSQFSKFTIRWLRNYARSRKVAGSNTDEVIGFFQLTSPFQPHYGPGVNSASNRNEYQESSSVCKELPAPKADNLRAICEPIV